LHYGLPVGLLREGDSADSIVVSDLKPFEVQKTFINGQQVYGKEEGVLFGTGEDRVINRFEKRTLSSRDLEVDLPKGKSRVRGIQCFDGDLVTDAFLFEPSFSHGRSVDADPERDILKIVVIDRYRNTPPSVGYIRGFGLTKGALATSVAHDSHNVVAVGTSDELIALAVNRIMESGGGMVALSTEQQQMLALPVAGLISPLSGEEVAGGYARVENMAREMGAKLSAPFMTLSFMSLLVIPKLKIGDQGLFDVDRFSFVSLFE
jgi:adenine deaminase